MCTTEPILVPIFRERNCPQQKSIFCCWWEVLFLGGEIQFVLFLYNPIFYQGLVVIVLILSDKQYRRRKKKLEILFWRGGDWHGVGGDFSFVSTPSPTKEPVCVLKKQDNKKIWFFFIHSYINQYTKKYIIWRALFQIYIYIYILYNR